jgi:hypothetical protein
VSLSRTCRACAASRYSRRRPTGSQCSAAPSTFSIAMHWRNKATASPLGCAGARDVDRLCDYALAKLREADGRSSQLFQASSEARTAMLKRPSSTQVRPLADHRFVAP